MILYRAMSEKELHKTNFADSSFNFDKCKNKWFTQSFGFLLRKLSRRSQYNYVVKLETHFNGFRYLNNKELMVNQNFPFRLLWIKKISELLKCQNQKEMM